MIRILLVADSRLLRTALAAALSHEPDLDVVTGSDDADVFVVDLDTLNGAVSTVVDTLTERHPDRPVLVLTTVAVSPALRHAFGCRVRAYLRKDCHLDELADAVRRVAAGESFIEPAIAASLMAVRPNPLTPRERDVLRLAAEGMSVRDIAGGLFLTAGTVRTYLSTVMQKLDARSRMDAIRIATEENWL